MAFAGMQRKRAEGPVSGTAQDAVVEPGPGGRFEAILDAGETVFADAGFNGASIREIATRAGVAQALVHYHFKTKEKLFEAVAARRSGEINDARGAMLDALEAGAGEVTLEALVEALFRPTIETGHRLGGSNSFSRILVSIANSREERDQALAQRYYDPIALRFISAFMEAEPALDRETATWAYMFSIGVGMTMMAQTGRANRLSQGACDDGDVETMLREIIVFICGGIRAQAQCARED